MMKNDPYSACAQSESSNDKLNLSIAQFQSIVELCPEPILLYCDHVIEYVNPAGVTMVGASNKAEMLGKSMLEFLLPEDIEAAMNLTERLLKEQKPSELIEKTWLRLDGTRIIVQFRAVPVNFDGKGAIQLLCRNITPQREAEQSLRDSEKRLDGILQLSPDAVIVHYNGIINFVNDTSVKLMRVSSVDQLIGKSIFDFMHPDFHKEGNQRMKLVKETKQCIDFIVYKMIRPNGEIFYGESSSVEIQNNPSKGHIHSVIRDISDRIKLEEALRESSLGYQRLIQFLPEPIVITDHEVIVYTNISAIKLTKAESENELIGKSIFDYLHPIYHAGFAEANREILETDNPTPFLERIVICKDGTQILVEVSSIRIDNYMGKSVILTVLRDLTERKNSEELLVKSEKLSVIGQLAAGVAHEIRNPLTALMGFTQLLQRDLGGKYHYLGIMLSELERINYIVSEFMSLAKPQMNQFKRENITDIMDAVISILETQAILKNAIITLDVEEFPIYITCDENQIKQVFVNIINNAMDAMPQGGQIRITILLLNSQQIRIQFHDQGEGIPEEVIRKIGEPFFTTKDTGTGLGLMISHRIIEAHQGRLEITSNVDMGTTVSITMPIHLDDSKV